MLLYIVTACKSIKSDFITVNSVFLSFTVIFFAVIAVSDIINTALVFNR